jgi:hypothetical protein
MMDITVGRKKRNPDYFSPRVGAAYYNVSVTGSRTVIDRVLFDQSSLTLVGGKYKLEHTHGKSTELIDFTLYDAAGKNVPGVLWTKDGADPKNKIIFHINNSISGTWTLLRKWSPEV